MNLSALLQRSEGDTLDFKRDNYRFKNGSDDDKSELLKWRSRKPSLMLLMLRSDFKSLSMHTAFALSSLWVSGRRSQLTSTDSRSWLATREMPWHVTFRAG